MTKEQEIKDRAKDEIKRLKTAQKWQRRCDKLKKRKKDPLNEQEFCQRHGISYTRFNRNKGDVQAIPTWDKIKQVEAAFSAEGV